MTTTLTGYATPAEWRTRTRQCGQIPAHGKPTEENLAQYVQAFEASTQAEGPNAHLGPVVVFSAYIKDQRTGEVKATYQGPSFVVV